MTLLPRCTDDAARKMCVSLMQEAADLLRLGGTRQDAEALLAMFQRTKAILAPDQVEQLWGKVVHGGGTLVDMEELLHLLVVRGNNRISRSVSHWSWLKAELQQDAGFDSARSALENTTDRNMLARMWATLTTRQEMLDRARRRPLIDQEVALLNRLKKEGADSGKYTPSNPPKAEPVTVPLEVATEALKSEFRRAANEGNLLLLGGGTRRDAARIAALVERKLCRMCVTTGKPPEQAREVAVLLSRLWGLASEKKEVFAPQPYEPVDLRGQVFNKYVLDHMPAEVLAEIQGKTKVSTEAAPSPDEVPAMTNANFVSQVRHCAALLAETLPGVADERDNLSAEELRQAVLVTRLGEWLQEQAVDPTEGIPGYPTVVVLVREFGAEESARVTPEWVQHQLVAWFEHKTTFDKILTELEALSQTAEDPFKGGPLPTHIVEQIRAWAWGAERGQWEGKYTRWCEISEQVFGKPLPAYLTERVLAYHHELPFMGRLEEWVQHSKRYPALTSLKRYLKDELPKALGGGHPERTLVELSILAREVQKLTGEPPEIPPESLPLMDVLYRKVSTGRWHSSQPMGALDPTDILERLYQIPSSTVAKALEGYGKPVTSTKEQAEADAKDFLDPLVGKKFPDQEGAKELEKKLDALAAKHKGHWPSVLTDERRTVTAQIRRIARLGDRIGATKQTTSMAPTPSGVSKGEENTMPPEEKTKEPLKETLRNDATDAAWRTAASQFVKLVREPGAALVARHLNPEDEALRNKIAAFMMTEAGGALLAGLLSLSLGAIPTKDPKIERLTRELRVKSMTDMGDAVADVLMGPLREVMTKYLKDLPEEPAQPAQLTQGSWTGVDQTVPQAEGVSR